MHLRVFLPADLSLKLTVERPNNHTRKTKYRLHLVRKHGRVHARTLAVLLWQKDIKP